MLIELIDVYKYYVMGLTTIKALNGINLKIDKGEFISIVGPSGSGKTTLLNIIGLLDRPTKFGILLKTGLGNLAMFLSSSNFHILYLISSFKPTQIAI